MEEEKVRNFVKKRYSQIAKTEENFNPSSCCCSCAADVAMGIGYSEEDLREIPAAANMGLGCGNPVALVSLKEGEIVLDLGSGGGIDVFLAAKRVGASGKAIGIDMTEEMMQKAKATADKYGYKNVEFRLGEIENLPVEDNSVDVIISNCVINLSTDKQRVFREAYRVLKPGGRIMISDMVTEEKLPDNVRKNLDAWAGCVAGALEKQEYMDVIRRAGFENVKLVSQARYGGECCDTKIVSANIEARKPNW